MKVTTDGWYALRTKSIAACVALSLAPVLAGCPDRALVSTIPSGAKVFWNNRLVGTSPVDLRIGRYEDWPTGPGRIEADGYEPFEFEVKTRVPPGRIVCYILTSAICLIFKRPTYFELNQYDFYLRALPAGASPSPDTEPAEDDDPHGPDARLRKIQQLYDQGLIDKKEYEEQRAKVLRGL